MNKVYNYIFDISHPLQPFSMKIPANPELAVPSNATRTEPVFEEGFVPCWIKKEDGKYQWELIEDNRGKTIYDTSTLQATECLDINIPKGFTLQAPLTKFDYWKDNKWVTDQKALDNSFIEENRLNKMALLDEANNVINNLTDIVNSRPTLTHYKDSLEEWKEYRVEVNLTNINTKEVNWPSKPINLLEV